MSTDSTQEITGLLQAWSQGDAHASERLLPLIYEPLRRLAHQYMRSERRDHTLEPTALVHEAYLRLTGGAAVDWQGRAHFYSLAARAMRRILVDHARARQRLRRGGVQQRIPADGSGKLPPDRRGRGAGSGRARSTRWNALPRRIRARARLSNSASSAAWTAVAIAEVLQVSERTVKRDWQFARLWLHRELSQRRPWRPTPTGPTA